MSNKQAHLIKAINEAQEAQGFTQKQLGMMAYISPGTISAAFAGKYNLKEEYWRSICEGLALDYDAIIAEAELEPTETQEAAEEIPVSEAETQEVSPVTEAIAPAAEVQHEAEKRCDTAAEEAPALQPVHNVRMADFLPAYSNEAGIIARYLAAKLRVELDTGTNLSMEDLYTLLNHLKRLQDIAGEG